MESSNFLEKLLAKDEHAFSMLMDTYWRLLWTVAARHLSKQDGFNASDLEECISDVFIELWENPQRFDPAKGSLKTYLCALTRNKAIGVFRKSARAKLINFEEYKEGCEHQDGATCEAAQWEAQWDPQALDYSTLYASICALPEPTKEILVRRYFYEQKPSEIAHRMQLPKKEVENRLYRAKQSLQKSLLNLREVQ